MHNSTDAANMDLGLEGISKIEGHLDVALRVKDGKVDYVKLMINENKRFYTQAVRGKPMQGVAQLVSRICGTCSIAHLSCCIASVESAIGLVPSEQTRKLRELVMWSLMIRDHAMHLYLFCLPDLYGKDSVLEFDSEDEKKLVASALEVKSAGNNLSKYVAGRAVHAPWPTVGGFTSFPDPSRKEEMIHQLEHARGHALEFVEIFYNCPWKFERKTTNVALVGDNFDYLGGDLHASNGTVISKKNFYHHLFRIVIPYSSATGFMFEGGDYLVGALSRLNLARHTLHPSTRRDCEKQLSRFPSQNIYDSNLAQAIEIVHCIDSSIEMLQKEEFKPEPLVAPPRKEGVGIGVIEAPRGTLYYNIVINDAKVSEANLVIPTAQNQVNMEKDLARLVQECLDAGKDREFIQHEMEKLIRAYDPCMSCATHFLKVNWK